MPITRPDPLRPANGAEHRVLEALTAQLGPSDALIANFRFTDETKDHEADAIVLLPGHGAAVLEIKGGRVWCAGGKWYQSSNGSSGKIIRPIDQARGCRYGLRTLIEADGRWRETGRRRFRWTHHVAVPYTDLAEEFAVPECPRWMIHDRDDMSRLVERLRDALDRQDTGN